MADLVMNKCKFCGNNLPVKGKQGPPKQYCNVICRVRYWESQELLKDTGRFCKHCGKSLNYKQANQCADCFSKAGKRKLQKKEEQSNSKTKVCEYCGVSFKTDKRTKNRQRFCNEKCERDWQKENRDWSKTNIHLYTCQGCGKQYETQYKDRDTFCSRECSGAWQSKQALVEKKCLSCGKIFVVKKSGWNYCSASCRKRGALNTCKICGNEFYSRNKGASICSNECQNKINLQKFREYKLSIGRNAGRVEQIACKHCGKKFDYKVVNAIPLYCSKKCNRAAWREANPETVKRMRRRWNSNRRARKYGNGKVESIDPLALFIRDGWICGICGKKVSPRRRYSDPMSASIDHIVALANGGQHIWNNVQCAHLLCNILKSNTGASQLRLDIPNEY